MTAVQRVATHGVMEQVWATLLGPSKNLMTTEALKIVLSSSLTRQERAGSTDGMTKAVHQDDRLYAAFQQVRSKQGKN